MHEISPFLIDLALVLGVAAVTTVLFRALRQPVVLGYLLAGAIIGPHLPIPLFVDPTRIETLSELGVILVMFSIGLEFSVRRLIRVLPTAGLTGVIQISSMMSLGFLIGQVFGWTSRESLFTGAMIAISSTMIVAKVFAEQGIRGKVYDVVFGILVVEDLAAVLLLALLTAISAGSGLSGTALAISAAQLAGFLVGMVVVGFLVVPRAIRMIARLGSQETLLVASIGLSFGLALVAARFGYSVALGAFLAGSLVAESGEGERVNELIGSVRDVFAAIFFVSVGMIIEPAKIVEYWPVILALTGAVIVGQTFSVSLGSFLSGNDIRTSVRAGMSLAQIGEFSFIIAAAGAHSGAVGDFLYPIAVTVAVVTTFTTPWLVRASEPVALVIDRRLPRRLQMFVSLYGAWLEDLRQRRVRGRTGPGRLVKVMVVDAVVIAVILVATNLMRARVTWRLEELLGLGSSAVRALIVAVALVACIPFGNSLIRCARSLGRQMATAARIDGAAPDVTAAPRRAMVVALQLVILAMFAVPLIALTLPLIPPLYTVPVLALGFAVFAVSFWRSAENLQAHTRAVAQVIIEALAQQAKDSDTHRLDHVRELLPAMGELTPHELPPGSAVVGKTLAELNVRGLTGATVIAIVRGEEEPVVIPSGKEVLREGDILALTGSHDAVEAAQALLAAREEEASDVRPQASGSGSDPDA